MFKGGHFDVRKCKRVTNGQGVLIVDIMVQRLPNTTSSTCLCLCVWAHWEGGECPPAGVSFCGGWGALRFLMLPSLFTLAAGDSFPNEPNNTHCLPAGLGSLPRSPYMHLIPPLAKCDSEPWASETDSLPKIQCTALPERAFGPAVNGRSFPSWLPVVSV